jgi:hypothetical protein
MLASWAASAFVVTGTIQAEVDELTSDADTNPYHVLKRLTGLPRFIPCLSPRHLMDPNTAAKIRGCFLGLPGRRKPRPVERDDMHLGQVSADLYFVSSEWWSSRSVSRPEIANSDRSFWGMLDVRSVVSDLASSTDSQSNSCFRLATS